MPEQSAAGNLIDNIVESLTDKSSEKPNMAENLMNNVMDKLCDKSDASKRSRLFGREKPVHSLLGGGKSADVLLWRNKKMSTGVLVSATLIWILFEWLNYNLLSFGCMALALGMIAQFLWASASGMLKSASKVPRLVLPEDIFVNIAVKVGSEVNRLLAFLQDVAVGRNLKQFLITVSSLWAAAILGSWFNFLTLIYVGFVAAHTLPVVYEKYEDEIESFLENLIGQVKSQYSKVNKRKAKWSKSE